MARKGSRENLAQTAIAYLIEQAVQNREYEKTLIKHALLYSRRHRAPIPRELRMKFCAKCRHIYSQSAVRRIKGQTMLIHCDKCGAIRRVMLEFKIRDKSKNQGAKI